MTHQAYEPTDSGEAALAPDAHRFVSEPKKRGSARALKTIAILLLIVVAVIAAGGWFAKDALRGWSDRRAARDKEQKERQAVPEVRKGKTFAQEDPAPPSRNASAPAPGSALPQGFGQSAPPAGGGLGSPIPLAAGPAGVSPAQQHQAGLPAGGVVQRPSRSLFVSDRDAAQEEVLISGSPARPVASTSTPPWATSQPPAQPLSIGTTTTSTPPQPPQLTGGPPPTTVQDVARAQRARATSLTATNQVSAAKLGDRSMLLSRGSYVPCVLETELNSNVPGPSSCIVTEHVYSDDGKTVLIEKGAKIQGEYKASMKQGDVRLDVIWKRIRTPYGIAVDVESPAGDELGAVGASGEVENHWMRRVGAAFLLSLVQDVVAARAARQQNGGTTVNAGSTGTTAKSMAEKVLDSTINIPPTLYKHRGERLMVLVNRDLWFDAVYALEKAQR